MAVRPLPVAEGVAVEEAVLRPVAGVEAEVVVHLLCYLAHRGSKTKLL